MWRFAASGDWPGVSAPLRPSARAASAAAFAFAAACRLCWGTSYYLAIDVPARLGGADHPTDQVLRSDDAAYSVALALGAGDLQFGALHRRPDGVWLFAAAAPFFPGGTPAKPHDVVSYDGISFSLTFNGSAAGVPEDVRIDALLVDPGGNPVFSFDVPVNLDGVEYSRSDLVRFSGGVFSLYWDAQAAGVPPDGNLVGADRDSAGTLVVTFDVPTRLAGIDYLPGQLVRWSGATFSSYFSDPAWPPSAQLRDFAFVPAAGVVPDGGSVPGTLLTVAAAGGNLTLSWGASCAASDTDYEIYEGILGTYYSHAAKFCSTGGATAKIFAMPGGSTYYLVVPRNAVSEGSYGWRTSSAERPPGAAACLPQQIAVTCP